MYRGKRCYSHETGQYLERRCKVYVYCIARKVILDPEENWIPWPKLSTATRFVGISRMRFGLIVIRGIHNWWFAYVSPEFHEKHPVSLIYHASVCQENMRIMSESHSAKNINNVNIGHYRYI